MLPQVFRPAHVAIVLVALVTVSCRDLTPPVFDRAPSAYLAVSPRVGPSRLLDPAQLRPVFGPQVITRHSGAPVTVRFTLAGYGPNAVLHVVNGDANGEHRSSSATITRDGLIVVSPSSFSQQMASLDVPFALGNPSTLAVQLAGAPGSTITISIDAQLATTAELSPSGGMVHLLGSAVTLNVPPGAVSATLTISATPVTPDPAQPANANVVGGSAVQLGPDGTQFSQSVTIALAYDPANLPAHFSQAALRLGTLVGGRWVEVKPSHTDQATHTTTAQTTHFSAYGVVAFETFTQLAIGLSHTCGLTPEQDAYCWGANSFGQLGSVSTTACTAPGSTVVQPCTPTPTLVGGGLKFAWISAGDSRTCGVAVSGDAYCWGAGNFGAIGDGGLSNRGAPALVAGGLHWASVSVGGASSTCGLTTTGHAYCWGWNSYGALGARTTELCSINQLPCATTPIAVASTQTFLEVSAGLLGGCALATNHTAWCWGWGQFGANGDGTTIDRPAPVAVAGGFLFTHVTAGGLSSCGVTADHTGYCWGTNISFRVLGIGVAPNSFTPIAVSGGLSFDQVLANNANNFFEHNCGLTTAGEVWCWGGNDAQQLGSTVSNDTCTYGAATWACQNVPVNAVPGQTFRAVSVGRELTCAQGTDGQAYCFGNNTFGQIGDGTVSTSRSYTRIPRP